MSLKKKLTQSSSKGGFPKRLLKDGLALLLRQMSSFKHERRKAIRKCQALQGKRPPFEISFQIGPAHLYLLLDICKGYHFEFKLGTVVGSGLVKASFFLNSGHFPWKIRENRFEILPCKGSLEAFFALCSQYFLH